MRVARPLSLKQRPWHTRNRLLVKRVGSCRLMTTLQSRFLKKLDGGVSGLGSVADIVRAQSLGPAHMPTTPHRFHIHVLIPNPAETLLFAAGLRPATCLRSSTGERPRRSGELAFACVPRPVYGEVIPGETMRLACPPPACRWFRAASRLILHWFVSGLMTAHLGHRSVVESSCLSAAAVECRSSPLHHRSIQYRSQPSSLLSRQTSATRPVCSLVYFSLTCRQWYGSVDMNFPQSEQ